MFSAASVRILGQMNVALPSDGGSSYERNFLMTALHGRRLLAGSLSLLLAASAAHAATPTVEQALKLMPVQKDVEIDTPRDADIPKATIKGEKMGSFSAWVVRDAAGQLLRKFADTNNDNIVDQWCYYRDGIEVYRDIDSNFNGKADQYRWLNTAGTRWGMDENEDTKVDSWKAISAEEVSAEVVRALAEQDPARFQRVLLTESELKSLGLVPSSSKSSPRRSPRRVSSSLPPPASRRPSAPNQRGSISAALALGWCRPAPRAPRRTCWSMRT
jgi:hypothetical protein